MKKKKMNPKWAALLAVSTFFAQFSAYSATELGDAGPEFRCTGAGAYSSYVLTLSIPDKDTIRIGAIRYSTMQCSRGWTYKLDKTTPSYSYYWDNVALSSCYGSNITVQNELLGPKEEGKIFLNRINGPRAVEVEEYDCVKQQN